MKQKSQIRASHSKKEEKGFARPGMMLILRIGFCRSEIKIFVRKRKFKPPHKRGFPTDEPVQGGNKRDGIKNKKGKYYE